MNEVILKGRIEDIEYSHEIKDVEYYKAKLIVKKYNGEEDSLNLRFKKLSCPYVNGQEIELKGNLRSYSQPQENGKNKVEIYVFTYFDVPEETGKEGEELVNFVKLDGRICKIDELRTTKNGRHNLHFTLANNIFSSENKQKLNNYLPCVVWGKLAKDCTSLNVSDKIELEGQLHSRLYKKTLDNGDIEFRVAHEVVVDKIYEI